VRASVLSTCPSPPSTYLAKPIIQLHKSQGSVGKHVAVNGLRTAWLTAAKEGRQCWQSAWQTPHTMDVFGVSTWNTADISLRGCTASCGLHPLLPPPPAPTKAATKPSRASIEDANGGEGGNGVANQLLAVDDQFAKGAAVLTQSLRAPHKQPAAPNGCSADNATSGAVGGGTNGECCVRVGLWCAAYDTFVASEQAVHRSPGGARCLHVHA
jgi:hypothetical protein